MTVLPCECGSTRAALVQRCPSYRWLVKCPACGRHTREYVGAVARDAAAAEWNAKARKAADKQLKFLSRAAARCERDARRTEHRLRRLASGLRADPAFVDAVLGRYVGYEPLNGTGTRSQVMRLPVEGADRRANMRAFVDGFLALRWPELAHLADPESVAHHVLHDHGHGVRTVVGRVRTHEYDGQWRRPEPYVGAEIVPATDDEEAAA